MKERYFIDIEKRNDKYESVFVKDGNDKEIIHVGTGDFYRDYDLVNNLLNELKRQLNINVLRLTSIDDYMFKINN
ncbi:hypothetical protein [Radiobacillus sp. PE A8.2]|uniref:hypothetical protein n=1 Tax=Radiobacillus sp. PE A8.2 TaxID=3380349 RepID=UPI00388EF66A